MPVDLASLTSDLTALFSDLTGNTAAEGAAALAQAVYDNVTDAGGATVADGDYGDITVDSGGTLWTINAGAVDRDTLNEELKPSGTAAPSDEALRALGTGAGEACAGNDARLSDTRTPTDGSVTAAKVASSLKPSGTAAAGDEALRALGTSSSTACAGNDSRLSDSRAPSGSASGDLSGSYPGPTVAKVAGTTPGTLGLALLDDTTAAAGRATLGITTPMLFGLGADGSLDFDGLGGTLAGATRSGTTYTATRDIRASAVTIRAGVTLKMVGFRLFVSGTLAIEATGAISNSGSAGSGTSGGASPGTGSPGTIASTATAGGNGRTTSGAGTSTTGTSPSIGGRGGAGGAAAGGSPAGGTAGSITAPTAVQGDLRDFDCLIRGQLRSGTGYAAADGGSGGGGGGHDGVSGNSGGGGGGGSALWIACDTINNAGKIQANGGDGAAATGTDNGGGGGGGGGWVLLVYRATTGSGLGTVEANGGTGGAGSGGGSAGSTGSVGTVYTLQYT